MRRATSSNQFECTDDLNILFHFLFDANLVPGCNLIGRDVDLLAVHDNVAVPYKLSCLSVTGGESQTDEDVVQTPFQLCQQVLTGDALLTGGTLEIGTELILEDAVDA